MSNYYDKEKLIIPNGKLIMKVNCKYCLPCGICELRSSFERKELCNEFEALNFKLHNTEDKS